MDVSCLTMMIAAQEIAAAQVVATVTNTAASLRMMTKDEAALRHADGTMTMMTVAAVDRAVATEI